MQVGKLMGRDPDPLKYQEDKNAWVAPYLRVGIEIELENPKGLRVSTADTYWSLNRDGSLRDNGVEMVLRQPLFGKDLTLAINAAEASISKAEHLVVNYRTGLHIHVDCRDLDTEELKRMFIIYSLFEKSLFNFVGDNRNLNNFCAPWFRISDHLESVFSIFDGGHDEMEARMNIRNVERYSALNCAALAKFGSIEFRHMQMTKDFQKIRNWINVIMSIYNAGLANSKYGPKYDAQDFVRLAAKGGAMQIARDIFPDFFLPFIDDRTIWDGIMLIQELCVNIQGTKKFSSSGNVLSICPHRGPSRGYNLFIAKNAKESA